MGADAQLSGNILSNFLRNISNKFPRNFPNNISVEFMKY